MLSDRSKRFVALLVLAGIAAVVVYVIRGGPRAGDDDRIPVATVGDHPITKARFTKEYVGRLMATGRNDTPTERWAQLDNLIQVRLLAEEARRRGLDAGPEFEELVERHRLMAAGNAYFMREYAEQLPPLTEQEVREAYRKSHERVVLRHLVFKDRRQAEVAVELLRGGEDFVDLANEVFDTPAWDSSAGMLGVASYWDLDDAVAEVAFDLGPREISDPVRSRYGWHVLRLENRIVNPLLIEEDFQTRRAGVEGRERIRRNRLGGDRWVRDFMESLDARVDTTAARLVVDALASVVGGEKVVPQVQITRSEIDEVRRGLEPGTPLVTYTMDGQERTFTAGDFVRWLPELPYEEVRDRPMAAVGRALRNEALGLKGLSDGLDREPTAVEAVGFAADRFLADTLRGWLRANERVEPTSEDIARAFGRLGLGAIREATGDWWSVPFPSHAEAEAALHAIRDGGRAPESFAGFERVEDGDLLKEELGWHLRRMTVGVPFVACLEDGSCVVARADDLDVVRATLDEKHDDLRAMLARILPEERLTDSLFGVSRVRVDTALFRQLMELR
jgi:parvulin-like peptidyl-prolyl isomerase